MSNRYSEQKSLERKQSEQFKPTMNGFSAGYSSLNRRHSERNSTQAQQFINKRLGNRL